MIATLTKQEHTGKIGSNRKEKHFINQYSVVVVDAKGCIKEIVSARFYQPGTRAYCCVWIHGKTHHLAGGGFAGGYGYHKASAALQSALDDAGVVLSQSIGGHGEGVMLEALMAVGLALGYSNPQIIHAHG